MDKIMFARLNEGVIRRIGMLAKRLNISRKAVIENAIEKYAQQIESDEDLDVFSMTCGSWKRDETAAETIRKIKKAIRSSQARYKK